MKKRERNSHFIGKHEPRIKGQRNARDGYDVGLGLTYHFGFEALLESR